MKTGGKDVNLTFNSFLNSFLRIFNSSFPAIQRVGIKSKVASITWITKGIKISCKHTRELYLLTKKNEDISIKSHYKRYYKILCKVIIVAKRKACNNYINKSQNKMKTTWQIINTETGRNKKPNSTRQLIHTRVKMLHYVY